MCHRASSHGGDGAGESCGLSEPGRAVLFPAVCVFAPHTKPREETEGQWGLRSPAGKEQRQGQSPCCPWTGSHLPSSRTFLLRHSPSALEGKLRCREAPPLTPGPSAPTWVCLGCSRREAVVSCITELGSDCADSPPHRRCCPRRTHRPPWRSCLPSP